MAKYFNYFPKTFYTSNNRSTGVDTVTNIIARFGFESKLKQNYAVFYEYNIQDGDTPEIIASKFYDSVERHWIVLLFNDIVDPQFDWPLDQRTIIKFIDEKYSANGAANTPAQSGLTWSQSLNNIHSYYKVITTTSATDSLIEKIEVDANTYANIATTTSTYTLQDGKTVRKAITKEAKTYYDYEIETNEAKRTIKLLKSDFVPEVEKEFKRVIKQ
jgi:hypothetical protein